jgi:hypothetical protein
MCRSFLRQYFKLKESGEWTFVFLDETWIFQHGNNCTFGWFDGSKEAAAKLKASNGKRFIILHAGCADGFIKNASLIFPSKIPHLDYHGDMSAPYFIKWALEQLIPNLPPKSCIVMDNASYHSTLVSIFKTMFTVLIIYLIFLVGKKASHVENKSRIEKMVR